MVQSYYFFNNVQQTNKKTLTGCRYWRRHLQNNETTFLSPTKQQQQQLFDWPTLKTGFWMWNKKIIFLQEIKRRRAVCIFIKVDFKISKIDFLKMKIYFNQNIVIKKLCKITFVDFFCINKVVENAQFFFKWERKTNFI